jgi:hypothetical protein
MLVFETVLKLNLIQQRIGHAVCLNKHNLFIFMDKRFQLMREGVKSELIKHMVFYNLLEEKDRIVTTKYSSTKQ